MDLNRIQMPRSGVVDASKNMRPEWREYIGATQRAAMLLKALIAQGGGNADALEARIDALSARIAGLAEITADDLDRLVMWRGTNISGGTQITFEHGLETRHIFWHIWDPISQRTFPTFMTKIHDQSDVHITISNDEFDPAPAGLDAVFIGVISDRY